IAQRGQVGEQRLEVRGGLRTPRNRGTFVVLVLVDPPGREVFTEGGDGSVTLGVADAEVLTTHGCGSPSARTPYSLRRVCARILAASACCSRLPVVTTCQRAPITWPT